MHRLQRDQLADPQAAGVHEFEHAAVAQTQRRIHVGRTQQRLNLSFAEHLGHAQCPARGQQLERGVGVDQPLAQGPAKVALEHGEPAVAAAGLAAGMSSQRMFAQVALGARVQSQAGVIGQPLRVKAQVAPVGGQRVGRQSVLDPHGIDETIDRCCAVLRGGHGDSSLGPDGCALSRVQILAACGWHTRRLCPTPWCCCPTCC